MGKSTSQEEETMALDEGLMMDLGLYLFSLVFISSPDV